MKNNQGKLYGVSVGPGDPKLMTLKAIETINATPVIAAPRTRGVNTMALDIVKAVCDLSDKEIIYLDFAMKRDENILDSTHKGQAKQIMEVLSTGKDVSMLNIGDASLFGTYCYVRDIVEENGFDTEVIPGITSFCAVASALNKSLTTMNEPLMIIPGGCDEVSEYLKVPGTKVIMKSNKDLPTVKDAIRDAGFMDRASLVANCGLPTERVYTKLEDSGDNEGYFATILIS